MIRLSLPFFLVAMPTVLAASLAAQRAEPSAGDLRRSGTVRFPVTCEAAVAEDFQTAVALLHSFFYDEARRRFEDIARRDPGCAMAWWGVAMTWYHPLWTPPTPGEIAMGRAATAKAKAIGGKSAVEAGFIAAIDAFFGDDGVSPAPASMPQPATALASSCHGPRAHSARAERFLTALERLTQAHPNELEATLFYTLALLGTAPPTDKEYRNQLRAAAILEPLFEQHPDHPGIAHYLIHALDYPTLAARALPAARRYDDIAPWVPHVLHMPSHIYTRLGMWDESIAANRASSAAARDHAARVYDGASTMDDLHAMDYLMFAYLQTARDAEADAVRHDLAAVRNIVPGNDFAAAYALGAIPARYVLERRDWKAAATLEVPKPDFLQAFPFAVAHIEFARAVGASRSGDVPAAKAAVAQLAALREQLTEPKFQWWIGQIEIQRLAAAGWLAQAEGDAAQAEQSLRKAAELEDQSGTHPVTPGQILPAREQLGDLLLLLDRPADALVEYERSLEAFPRRFHSHHGAGLAAERCGKPDVARRHYEALLAMAGDGNGRREELARARAQLR